MVVRHAALCAVLLGTLTAPKSRTSIDEPSTSWQPYTTNVATEATAVENLRRPLNGLSAGKAKTETEKNKESESTQDARGQELVPALSHVVFDLEDDDMMRPFKEGRKTRGMKWVMSASNRARPRTISGRGDAGDDDMMRPKAGGRNPMGMKWGMSASNRTRPRTISGRGDAGNDDMMRPFKAGRETMGMKWVMSAANRTPPRIVRGMMTCNQPESARSGQGVSKTEKKSVPETPQALVIPATSQYKSSGQEMSKTGKKTESETPRAARPATSQVPESATGKKAASSGQEMSKIEEKEMSKTGKEMSKTGEKTEYESRHTTTDDTTTDTLHHDRHVATNPATETESARSGQKVSKTEEKEMPRTGVKADYKKRVSMLRKMFDNRSYATSKTGGKPGSENRHATTADTTNDMHRPAGPGLATVKRSSSLLTRGSRGGFKVSDERLAQRTDNTHGRFVTKQKKEEGNEAVQRTTASPAAMSRTTSDVKDDPAITGKGRANPGRFTGDDKFAQLLAKFAQTSANKLKEESEGHEGGEAAQAAAVAAPRVN